MKIVYFSPPEPDPEFPFSFSRVRVRLTAEHEVLIKQLERLWANLRAGAPSIILQEVLHEIFSEVGL
jgi:hypothetical protein